MRDRLHEYLLARPGGAPADELIGLVFTAQGRDPEFGPRFLHALLDDDARFVFDAGDRVWRVRQHESLARPVDDGAFVVFDLETTGDAAALGCITEIGAVRVAGGRIVDEFATLVNPGRRIHPFVVALTGITDEMVASAPRIQDVLPRFLDFAADAVLVAHNASFDVDHLDVVHRLVRGTPLARPALCTLKLARRLLPDLKRRNLDALAAHLGIAAFDRHRALGDARITAEILTVFVERARTEGVVRLDQLLDFQHRAADGRPFVMQVPRERLDGVPARPGIYHLLGDGGRLLYVGKARDLRRRLASYFSNARGHSSRVLEMIRQVRDLATFETGSELSASLLEARQIRELKPPYNRQRRHLPRVAWLKLSLRSPWPRLWVTERLTGDRAVYVGPFGGVRAAERTHAVLTRLLGLRFCPERLRPSPDVTPCLSGQVGACTAPCAARIARDAYRARVDRLLTLLDGDASLLADLQARRAQHVEREEFEQAARVQRDLDVLEDLRRRQASLHWVVARQNFAVLLPTAERDAAQFYAVLGGRLAVESRIAADTDLVVAAHHVRDRYAEFQDAPLGKEDVEAATILGAWLRQRGAEGLLLPLDGPESIFARLDELTVTVGDLRQRGPLPAIDGLR